MARVRYQKASQPDKPIWRRWMRAFGAMRETHDRKAGYDPLLLGEVSTVGVMLSAAGRVGLIGLLEYPTRKRTDMGDGDCHGRCDLWLMSSRDSDSAGWAFEVKHARISSRTAKKRLVQVYRSAWRDAGALQATEASKRIACTVLYSNAPVKRDTVCARTLDWLAKQSDWAWRIDHPTELTSAYIFMRHRRRANRVLVPRGP